MIKIVPIDFIFKDRDIKFDNPVLVTHNFNPMILKGAYNIMIKDGIGFIEMEEDSIPSDLILSPEIQPLKVGAGPLGLAAAKILELSFIKKKYSG